MKDKYKIINVISIIIAVVSTAIAGLSVLMLLNGEGNPPLTDGDFNNWTGTLNGQFLGFCNNSTITAIVCSFGIIACIYLIYTAVFKISNKVLIVLTVFVLSLFLLINCFVNGLCASIEIIVILLIVCFILFYCISYKSFYDPQKKSVIVYVQTIVGSAFLTLLVCGLLYDLVVLYKAVGF